MVLNADTPGIPLWVLKSASIGKCKGTSRTLGNADVSEVLDVLGVLGSLSVPGLYRLLRVLQTPVDPGVILVKAFMSLWRM